MIEREQIQDILNTRNTLNGNAADAIMALIAEHDEQYRELVEAAVEITTMVDLWHSATSSRFVKAVQPFLPRKTSLSEDIYELARGHSMPAYALKRWRELAEEARKLEAALEDKS